MVKFVSGVALFALVGLGLCGFAASQAKAYSCQTSCYTVFNQQYCNTTCF